MFRVFASYVQIVCYAMELCAMTGHQLISVSGAVTLRSATTTTLLLQVSVHTKPYPTVFLATFVLWLLIKYT